jgi:hypothetical protein
LFEEWRSNDFFEEICSPNFFYAISYFCIIIIPVSGNFWDSNKSTEYQDEKLSRAYKHIHDAAKELAPKSSTANPDNSFSIGDLGLMFGHISSALDDLLKQPNLKEGDIAILKFFRNLVEFTWDERGERKFLPIPDYVSFSFARFLSVCLDQPTRILVPQLDDRSQRESLRKYLEIT